MPQGLRILLKPCLSLEHGFSSYCTICMPVFCNEMPKFILNGAQSRLKKRGKDRVARQLIHRQPVQRFRRAISAHTMTYNIVCVGTRFHKIKHGYFMEWFIAIKIRNKKILMQKNQPINFKTDICFFIGFPQLSPFIIHSTFARFFSALFPKPTTGSRCVLTHTSGALFSYAYIQTHQ